VAGGFEATVEVVFAEKGVMTRLGVWILEGYDAAADTIGHLRRYVIAPVQEF